MTEIWKNILEYPNYKISNFGNIMNINKNKILHINYERLKKTNTRVRPGLSKDGKIKQFYLHRLVAEYFIDNPNDLPEVNHIDGNIYNNNASNLEWISKIDNMRHANDNNLINRWKRAIIVIDKNTKEKKIFESVSKCAEYFNYSKGRISNYCNNKYNNKNYIFSYETKLNDYENNDNIIWKEYPENNKYLVSNTGQVKNKKTNRLMMGSKVSGYRFVNLYINSSTQKTNRLIHRMVAQTFIENPDNKPYVNHIDTNILNNSVDNLEWVTQSENMNTSKTIENLKKGKDSKKILQIEIDTEKIINSFYGANEVQKETNISPSTILNICNYYNNNNKKYGGMQSQKTYQKKYIFIFEENKNNIKEYIKIAKNIKITKNKICNIKALKVCQLNKNTLEIINIFNSGYEASKKLNLNYSAINQCCQYYKYNNNNRPNCYKLQTIKGFIFKFI